MQVLIVGGSGFVSGALARRAVAQGHAVWVLTRGQRPVPEGVAALRADRHQAGALESAVASAGTVWDLAVDCIGYEPADVVQDLQVLTGRAGHLVFVSTDFVFDPARRRFPQGPESEHYASAGYGGLKRRCERELLARGHDALAWTVLRPCHVYGPGSLLGCLPLHGRDPQLLARLRAGEPLRLVGGGHFLQQPIMARDLADVILGCVDRPRARRRIFCAAGPDLIESRTYYEIVADAIGARLRVEEVPVGQHRTEHPESVPFLCHRIYDLDPLAAADLPVPATPIAEGLREHVRSLLC